MKTLIILTLLAFLAGCTAPLGSAGDIPLSNPASSNPVSSSLEKPQSTAAPSPGASTTGVAPLAIWQDGMIQLHLVDLATGEDARGRLPLALPAGVELSASAASESNAHIALASGTGTACRTFAGGSACYQAADTLHLLDTAAWQMRDVPLPGKGSVSHLVFSSDGSHLALVYNTAQESSLYVYAGSSGEQLARTGLDIRPEWLGYALGGKVLVVFGSPPGSDPGVVRPPAPRLLLLDPASLQADKELRFDSMLSGEWCLENCDAPHEQRHFALWRPAIALSSDGSYLYLVHAHQDILSSIDLEMGAVHDASIEADASWLERLLVSTAGVAHAKGLAQGAIKFARVSPDGSRLLVITEQFSPDPKATRIGQKFQVIELSPGQKGWGSTGRMLVSVQLHPDYYMSTLLPGTDGELLLSGYIDDKTLLQAVSADDLQLTTSLTGWQASAGPGVLLGQRPAGSGSELAAIDPNSLQVLSSWQVEEQAAWLPMP